MFPSFALVPPCLPPERAEPALLLPRNLPLTVTVTFSNPQPVSFVPLSLGISILSNPSNTVLRDKIRRTVMTLSIVSAGVLLRVN
jgi:hypothetical protein